MSRMKPGKHRKKGDHKYQFTKQDACCKYFDQRSLTFLFINISDMQLTSTVQQRMNVSATKFGSFVQLLLRSIFKV